MLLYKAKLVHNFFLSKYRMRAFLYVILFAVLSPGMFFHIAAPKGKSIQFKSVIIHAFLFGLAAYILNVLVKTYPILDGFSGNNSESIIERAKTTVKKAVTKAKEAIGIRQEARIPSHGGSLPPPMTPEKPMEHSIQHTASHGRVGSLPGM